MISGFFRFSLAESRRRAAARSKFGSARGKARRRLFGYFRARRATIGADTKNGQTKGNRNESARKRTPEAEAAAKEAGADYVGLDEYIDKIKGGWTDVDVIITMPAIMGKIGALGRVLGPRGLMPNPKSGTVTMDVAKAVREVKQGKIDFKVDKTGIVHTSIGKVSFTPEQILGNAKEFIATIIKLKPAAAKGTYIKSIYLSSTMSKGIKVDPKSVEEI